MSVDNEPIHYAFLKVLSGSKDFLSFNNTKASCSILGREENRRILHDSGNTTFSQNRYLCAAVTLEIRGFHNILEGL
jgi:hypothetical protein